MVALLFTACGAQFADDCGADFAGDSGLLKMNQEESAQGCGSDFAGEIGVVDFAADALRSKVSAECIPAGRSNR